MLKEEIDNCVAYYQHREVVILEEIQHFSLQLSSFNRGAAALLQNALAENRRTLDEFINASKIINSDFHSPDCSDSCSDISSSDDEY